MWPLGWPYFNWERVPFLQPICANMRFAREGLQHVNTVANIKCVLIPKSWSWNRVCFKPCWPHTGGVSEGSFETLCVLRTKAAISAINASVSKYRRLPCQQFLASYSHFQKPTLYFTNQRFHFNNQYIHFNNQRVPFQKSTHLFQ